MPTVPSQCPPMMQLNSSGFLNLQGHRLETSTLLWRPVGHVSVWINTGEPRSDLGKCLLACRVERNNSPSILGAGGGACSEEEGSVGYHGSG